MSAVLPVAVWALAGALAGAAYFWAVWKTAGVLTGGRGRVGALGLTLLRFALLAGFLIVAARNGAGPLLAAALGVLLARLAVVRRLGSPAP
jgi:F1F0 ATPase subunit 2